MAGVSLIADDFLHRVSRQTRAKALNRFAIVEVRLGWSATDLASGA
jgi:hypothetical protein